MSSQLNLFEIKQRVRDEVESRAAVARSEEAEER